MSNSAITVSANIDKSEIAAVGELKGKANSRGLDLAGVSHPARTLRFLGFRGAHIGGQRYAGVYVLEQGKYLVADVAAADLGKLPGLGDREDGE